MTSHFRIIINLSNYFADHRRQARICVNDAIQTIGDLQNKISNIFDIQDFYLVCDNDFLPPSEDVHVIQSNDVVWIMPANNIAQSICTHSTPLHNPSISRSLKQNRCEMRRKKLSVVMGNDAGTEDIPAKKKRRHALNGVDNNIQDIESSTDKNEHKLTANGAVNNIPDIISPKREKTKKKKKCIVNEVDRNDQEIVNSGNTLTANGTDTNICEVGVSGIKKKKKNIYLKHMESVDNFWLKSADSGKTKKQNMGNNRFEINWLEKTANSVGNDKKITSSLLSNTDGDQIVCKGDLASYTKKQPVPTTTDEYLKEKKINIVRIDYVTTGDTTNNTESQIVKSNANQSSSLPKMSLLSNVSPIEFAPELTCIEEKSSAMQCIEFVNKNEQDMNIKNELPKKAELHREPQETCIASEPQIENIIIVEHANSAQHFNSESGVQHTKNLEEPSVCPLERKAGRIMHKKNMDYVEYNRNTEDSKEASGIVSGGTELDQLLNNDDSQQNVTVDVKTPKNKVWSYKEISPLRESLLAGFTSSVLESTRSIAIEDIYGKSPAVSGCHWVRPDSRTAKPEHREISGVGQLLENMRTAPNIKQQVLDDITDVDSFVTFRKRKRSRRRIKKNRFETDDRVTSPLETVPMPKPLVTKANPTIHIKFDDDGMEDLNNTKKENSVYSIAGDNIDGRSYPESHSQLIQKATPMNGILPNIGDTIAFKVLKISESYTPEVSAYIIGKVMKYNPSDESIQFYIIAGLEELKEPDGKLSIAENDAVSQKQPEEYTWNWTELIEPRLFS